MSSSGGSACTLLLWASGGKQAGHRPGPVNLPARSAAFTAQGIPGMGLVIYDAQGTKRFERYYGSFSGDQRVAIASASKMVAGLVLFRLIDQGYLTLDSSTGAVLGWSGPQAAITLRQLLSFTSGLEREAGCVPR